MDVLQKIDRFGVMAVMGRPVLFFGELNRMIYAENVVAAYRSRPRDNWAEWTDKNPVLARLLAEAEKLCQ